VPAEIPYWERPCAAQGLKSYRYKGGRGWIMIGAADDADALSEAACSSSSLAVTLGNLPLSPHAS
jgi:hypothetical protein